MVVHCKLQLNCCSQKTFFFQPDVVNVFSISIKKIVTASSCSIKESKKDGLYGFAHICEEEGETVDVRSFSF